jgi:hypothetical protein
MTKSKTANVSLEATLSAILGKLQQQDERLNGMAQLITQAPAKPAETVQTKNQQILAKVQAAKAVQELTIELVEFKGGPAVLLKIDGSSWGIALRKRSWQVLKSRAAEIEAAVKRLPD